MISNFRKKGMTLPFVWGVVFVLCGSMYILTTQPGVCWQDSGARQLRIINGDYVGDLGLALSHPLYIAIGRLFLEAPVSDPATRLNAASGVGMALAVANLVIIIVLLTGKRWIGFAAGGAFAVMHTIWWLATITEVYAWNAAFMTAELLVLIFLVRSPKWQFASLLFFLNGLNVSIHNLALLALPVYVFVLVVLCKKKCLPIGVFMMAACGYCAGAFLFIVLVVNAVLATGDLWGTVHSALFGKYSKEVLSLGANWKYYKINAGILSFNLISVVLPLAVIGWRHMTQRIGTLLGRAFLTLTIIQFLFAVRYPVPDQFMFFVPSLVMVVIAFAIGVIVLAEKSRKWFGGVVCACVLSLIIPPFVYANVSEIFNFFEIKITRELSRPFRDELKYWAVPWKASERSAEQFAIEALKKLPSNSMVLCDGTAYYPLRLHQTIYNAETTVELRKSLNIPGGSAAELSDYLQERPVFAVLPNVKIASLEGRECLEVDRAAGEILYRVRWKCP